jgi:hypothetical protein
MKSLVCGLSLILAGAAAAGAQVRLGESVVANGGGSSGAAGIAMQSTAGQAAIGHAWCDAVDGALGFWLPMGGGSSDVPDADAVLPSRFELTPCRPNPMGREASLQFGAPAPARVAIRLYDVTGREVRTLADADYAAGWHRVPIESRGLPSGVYLCRMTADGFRATQRFILAR